MRRTVHLLSRRNFLKVSAAAGLLGGASLARSRQGVAHTGDPTHGGYADALTHKVMDDFKQFTIFLRGSAGYVGEVGWPNNNREVPVPPFDANPKVRAQAEDEEAWDALAETWWKEADARRLWVTCHDTTERQLIGRGYGSTQYCSRTDDDALPLDQQDRAISLANFQAARLEAHTPAAPPYRGVNFSGGQNWTNEREAQCGGIPFNHNQNPGTFNVNYWYPGIDRDNTTGQDSFEYLRSRGHTIVRIGFRWERMQPDLSAGLSPTEIQRYRASVNAAVAASLKVIINLANFGGYYFPSGRAALNTSQLPVGKLTNFWKLMNARFKDVRGVIAYDIMNEPFGDGGINQGSYPSKAKAWEGISQQVVTGLRNAGVRKRLMIPLYCGMGGAATTHPAKWITDPKNYFMYTAHHYWDIRRAADAPVRCGGTEKQVVCGGSAGGGGHYKYAYPQENCLAQHRGW